MGLLNDKVAIVTGAGNGIGREEALLLASEGAAVVVNDLGGARDGQGSDDAVAKKVADEIVAAGGRAVASYDSVVEARGADAIIATALEAFGRLDILVNNAGILRDKTLLKMADDMWEAVMAVHLDGTFYCTRAAARVLKEQGDGGRIINTTSVSGLYGNFGQVNYSAAKAGIYGITRTAAQELKRYGVTVNAIAPIARTRLTDDLPFFHGPGMDTEAIGPQFIAPVAAFLASDLAADITGEVIGVAGPRVYRFEMKESAGVIQPDQRPWTPAELAERWAEIATL